MTTDELRERTALEDPRLMEAVEGLLRKGEMEIVGTTDAGEVRFALTPKGRLTCMEEKERRGRV